MEKTRFPKSLQSRIKKYHIMKYLKKLSRNELMKIAGGTSTSLVESLAAEACPLGCKPSEICFCSYNGPTWCQDRPCCS